MTTTGVYLSTEIEMPVGIMHQEEGDRRLLGSLQNTNQSLCANLTCFVNTANSFKDIKHVEIHWPTCKSSIWFFSFKKKTQFITSLIALEDDPSLTKSMSLMFVELISMKRLLHNQWPNAGIHPDCGDQQKNWLCAVRSQLSTKLKSCIAAKLWSSVLLYFSSG